MYLSKAIDNAIESNKDKFVKKQSYRDLLRVLNDTFNYKDLKIVIEKFEDFGHNEYSFSGLYDMVEDKKYIVLNLSKKHRKFEMSNAMFKDFKFLLSQVLQHESLHQCQWSHRPEEKEPCHVDFRDNGMGQSKEEERLYLSCVDEIEAYGHDIALEIKYFYPRTDPYKILRYMGRYKRLTSFFIYKKAFKGIDWNDIKKRLLRKTYDWVKNERI